MAAAAEVQLVVGRRRRRVLLVIAAVCAGVLLLARPGVGDGDPAGPAPPSGRDPAAMVPAVPPSDRTDDPTGGRPPATTPATDPPPASPPPPRLEPHNHDDVAEQETLAPAAAAEAIAVAEQFAEVWASPAPDWHKRLAPLATEALASALAGADPPQPPPEFTGAGQVFLEAPAWARVGLPARRGTLVLDVLLVGDGWLVSAVDWELA